VAEHSPCYRRLTRPDLQGHESHPTRPYFGWHGGVERSVGRHMNGPLGTGPARLHYPLDTLKAARKSATMRTLAMTNKIFCNSSTALIAFAIVTFVSASSSATEFAVHQGKRYRAILALRSVEQLVDNALIAQKFRDLGFSGVRVSGAGARRRVEGVWPGKDTSANMPPQIVAVAKL
jgi:hypothetical protein